MNIGYFGGSFNPPTIAHLNLATQAIEQYNLDLLYFVPVNNYYKKQGLIEFNTRCEMLEIICKNNKKLRVSKIESKKTSQFSAHEIFKLISEQNSNNNIFFIMGEDNYEKMPKWENYEELMQYKYIIFQRKDSKEIKIKEKNMFYMKNNENLKISSSIIRNRLKNKQSIDKYVTNEIKDFIIKNKLYI